MHISRHVRKSVRLAVAAILFLSSYSPDAAHAVPTLQLYSPGAVYDTTTESWFTTDNPFELYVAGADQPTKYDYIKDVTLHIAISSQYYNAAPTGSVTIEGVSSSLENGPFTTVTLNASDFTYGQPGALNSAHGVYDAWYASVALENLQVDNHLNPVMDYVGGGETLGDIDIYRVTYNDFFLIHLDLTGNAHYVQSGKDKFAPEFAPYSHDLDADPPTHPVPEPATFLLMAAGIAGLGMRRFIKS
ncbi:MAG: choice-of-anchor N protein [Nitrospirota bacterium]|nr:choice-of-anchor N protein [Nitrospirota bacterium]